MMPTLRSSEVEERPCSSLSSLSSQRSSPGSSSFQDDKAAPTLSTSRIHKVPLINVLLPSLVIILATAGVASVFLGWLVWHSTLKTPAELWNAKAFVLDEGEKERGGLRSGSLLGLTIASASSTMVTMVTPIFLGLCAFSVADAWLAAVKKAEDEHLPTPLQYGLALELMASSGWMSVARTLGYLWHSRGRTTVAPVLKRAFVSAVLCLILSLAIAGVDLWLHVSTTSILADTFVPVGFSMPYGVTNKNPCVPYSADVTAAFRNCGLHSPAWADGSGTDVLAAGNAVATNSSDTLRAITLANSSDMAVLVNPSVPYTYRFQMSTFGVRTSCDGATSRCDSPTPGIMSCKEWETGFPPVNGSVEADVITTKDSHLYLWFQQCMTCPHISSDDFFDASLPIDYHDIQNNYSVWLQFNWKTSSDESFGTAPSPLLKPYSNQATALATCQLSFYNVTLHHQNGTYELQDEELSHPGLSDGLILPTAMGHYSNQLMSDIQSRMFTKDNADEVLALLSQDLGRLALASAAHFINETTEATSKGIVATKVLAHYPLVPVIVLLTLLYAYSALTILLAAKCLLFGIKTAVQLTYPSDETRNARPVSEALLAQTYLTRPSMLVALLFPPIYDNPSEKAKASIEMESIAVFGEMDHTPGRLALELQQDESGNRSTTYGIFQRSVYLDKRGEGMD